MQKKTALLSAYDKTGLAEFAQALVARGWNILGSRGTVTFLADAGIPATDIADIVGKPILGHRVVTLSREIHAGILAQPTPTDEAELNRLSMPRIDLVYVNLYPLQAEIADPDSTRFSVTERTDVGGPTLLHSAAKGERIVICDPKDCAMVINWLDDGIPEYEGFIDRLRAKADAEVADYCLAASRYHSQGAFDGMVGTLYADCKYGENPWQGPAGLYRCTDDDPLAIHNFQVIAGTPPSYNNYSDLDRMLQTITHIAAAFDLNRNHVPYIGIGVKHGNACGAAYGADPAEVASKMANGNNRAIFGGLVMTNFPVDVTIADVLLNSGMVIAARKRLLDGIIAPSFHEDAVTALARKGGKCRLLANPALEGLTQGSLNHETLFRPVRGGFLKQPNYTFVLNLKDPRIQWIGTPTDQQQDDLLLAWAVGSTSNSNTVTLVRNGQLIGNGVGQQDRVGCAKLAVKCAEVGQHATEGAVAYSDSFFPFPDGPGVLIDAGVRAILASSGSLRDDAVKALCLTREVPLLMIPDFIGRGFYRH